MAKYWKIIYPSGHTNIDQKFIAVNSPFTDTLGWPINQGIGEVKIA